MKKLLFVLFFLPLVSCSWFTPERSDDHIEARKMTAKAIVQLTGVVKEKGTEPEGIEITQAHKLAATLSQDLGDPRHAIDAMNKEQVDKLNAFHEMERKKFDAKIAKNKSTIAALESLWGYAKIGGGILLTLLTGTSVWSVMARNGLKAMTNKHEKAVGLGHGLVHAVQEIKDVKTKNKKERLDINNLVESVLSEKAPDVAHLLEGLVKDAKAQ